ncbi:MAG: hypothetical protein ACLPSF_05490 [Methylocella sp.]
MADIPAGVTVLLSLTSSVLVVFLTNALNARRSTNEKLWELRRTAYGSILAELTAAEWVLDSADEYIEEDETRYFYDVDPAWSRHSPLIGGHMEIARKSYVDNYLIMSERFIELFESFLRSLDNKDPNLSLPEEYEAFAAIIRAARPKLLQQARREMPLPRSAGGGFV